MDKDNQRAILYRIFEPVLFHLAKLKILEVTHPQGIEDGKQRSALRVWRYTSFGKDFSAWSERQLVGRTEFSMGEQGEQHD
jgi:hypothetical protein